MSARAAARSEWVNDRAKQLLAGGFTPADARAQAEREFDTADAGVDFRTRGLATGDLTYNERRELVDRRGRVVFSAEADDRRQRIDPDVDERDPEDEGDPNAVTPATLQREVHIDVRGSHGSGRRRRKKPPAPDAVEAVRSHEAEKSLVTRPALVGARVSKVVHEAVTGKRIGVSAGEIVEEFVRSCVEADLTPSQVQIALEGLEEHVRFYAVPAAAQAS